jgi:trehalose 6-phosphate synthase
LRPDGARRKLIVVSNRGPVGYGRDERGERVVQRGAGGLVTALRGLLTHHDVTWIASAMTDDERALAGTAVDEAARDGSPYRLRFVAHEPEAYRRFYNVVANPVLWFVQHDLWDLPRSPRFDRGFRESWEHGYAAVNRAFADAVLAELEREPEAIVSFHDYHLYLAPRFVRDARPDALLTHFVHIPWPQSDAWRVLPAPMRRAVHEGVLANDVVGFHTERWARNFRLACRDVLDVDADSEALVTAHPISVDPDEFEELARSEAVLAAEAELEAARPERLILRVDRTDLSKNILRGFLAFEQLLESRPQLVGVVRMLALLDPSRQDIPEYREYLAAIVSEAARINERFGAVIQCRIEDDFPGSVAAYKQFDVLLVNSVYDGLNLVAKEAPLVNRRDGVLVLSENAGAHEELGEWALTVSPFDVAGQAEALAVALELPEDVRRRRLEAIRDHVRRHDVEEWIAAQLADADRAAERRTMRP